MNKRQRKKAAKKYLASPLRSLMDSTRRILRSNPLSPVAFNEAWRNLQDDLGKASGTHAAAGKDKS